MTDEATVSAFRMMRDEFPGMARLIDKNHVVVTASLLAISIPGE